MTRSRSCRDQAAIRAVLTLALIAPLGGCIGGLKRIDVPDPLTESVAPVQGDCDAVTFGGFSAYNRYVMAGKPVGSAIGENIALPAMSSVVNDSGLKPSLDKAPALTVMVPSDKGYATIPAAERAALEKNPPKLAEFLRRHVIAERLAPQQFLGEHKTWGETKITVTMEGGVMTINGTAPSFVET